MCLPVFREAKTEENMTKELLIKFLNNNYSEEELNELANRLLGKVGDKTVTENQYGKGRVIWGQDVNQVFARMNVQPDLQFKGTHPKTALDYIHRTTNDQKIYLGTNRFSQMAYNDFEYRYLTTLPDRWEQVECSFRVTGKAGPGRCLV